MDEESRKTATDPTGSQPPVKEPDKFTQRTDSFNEEETALNEVSRRTQMPRLQGYSVQNIESWFQRLESYFDLVGFNKIRNKNTCDIKKFHHVIISIDEKLYEKAVDVIKNPPEQDRYETLKRSILDKFLLNSNPRLEQITNGIQLDDEMPSHILAQLQRTAVTNDQKLVRDSWLQRLSLEARAVVIGLERGSGGRLNLNELANMADEIVASLRVTSVNIAAIQRPPTTPMVINANPQTTASVNTANGPSSMELRMVELEKDVETVKITINRIESKLNPATRGRSNERRNRSNASSSPSKNLAPTPPQTCWFHREYGARAKKCTEPCDFKPTKSEQIRTP